MSWRADLRVPGAGDSSSFRKGHWGSFMDVVISTGWRNSTSTFSLDAPPETPRAAASKQGSDAFCRKIGRFEITLYRDIEGWVVEVFSTGRLFGPKVRLHRECHQVTRYAAWDVMARVIHAGHDEEEGITAGRQAAAWLRERETTVC